ncbi:hypothetical protein D3C71_2141400 [compost metagenome]
MPSIIDENIDRTAESLLHLTDQTLDLRSIRHIRLHQYRLAAGSTNCSHRILALSYVVQAVHADLSPVNRERKRDGTPDA